MAGYDPGVFGRNSHIPAVRDPFLEENYHSELRLTTQKSALNVEHVKPRYANSYLSQYLNVFLICLVLKNATVWAVCP